MIKTRTITMIDVDDFDNLVVSTYGRPYSLQQQDGCKGRGLEDFTVPDYDPYDFENDTIPEEVNGDERGVSFSAWTARDPKQQLDTEDRWDRENGIELFWHRNFYPTLESVTQDLYEKGLIPAGSYTIDIDW